MVRFSKKSVTTVSGNSALKNCQVKYLARKLWPSRLYTGPDLSLGWLRKKLAIFWHWFWGDTLSGSGVSCLLVIIVLYDSVLVYKGTLDFWLFVYRQGSSVDSRMNEWMKTRNDRNGDRVWKCTSVNDPCLQVYLQCGGLKWRKMEKKNIRYT